MLTPEEQDRKKKLQEFLDKSQSKRTELQSAMQKKAAERQELQQKQQVHAKAEIAKEEQQAVAKKEAMEHWKEQQKEQKKEIAEMIAAKEAEQERLKKKREAEKERIKQQKEYMRTLRWSRAMSAAKEKRKKVAKQAKDAILDDAEHDYRRDTGKVAISLKEQTIQIQNEAKQKRENTLSTQEQKLHDISLDARDARAKLFKKERTERANWEAEINRKKLQIRQVKDPAMRRQLEQEVERQHKKLESIHIKKYNKLQADIEVDRERRMAEAKRDAKKSREKISQQERQTLEQQKQDAWHEKIDLMTQFSKEKERAHKKEQEVLTMDLDEAFGLEIEEVGDED